MRRVFLLYTAAALIFPVYSQPMELQFAAAQSDKLQKDFGPYKRAITEQLGVEFRHKHGPYDERRRACLWDGSWVECGYLKLSQAASITASERQMVEKIMLNPCAHLSFPLLQKTEPKIPDVSASFQERKVWGSYQKARQLKELCDSAMFNASAVRHSDGKSLREDPQVPRVARDEIAYEAKISMSKTK